MQSFSYTGSTPGSVITNQHSCMQTLRTLFLMSRCRSLQRYQMCLNHSEMCIKGFTRHLEFSIWCNVFGFEYSSPFRCDNTSLKWFKGNIMWFWWKFFCNRLFQTSDWCYESKEPVIMSVPVCSQLTERCGHCCLWETLSITGCLLEQMNQICQPLIELQRPGVINHALHAK